MLVFSRKVGEKFVIGGNITVEVVKIQGNRISVGIVAPTNVKILRGELVPSQSEAPTHSQPATQTTPQDVEDGLLVAC